MKRAISLILALVLCLSLCACGGGTQYAKIGDTVATDRIEFVLTRFEFSNHVYASGSSKYLPISDDEIAALPSELFLR